ncbi:hypothetical protein F5B21DRAFT_525032, partial [Xylaria acuta]
KAKSPARRQSSQGFARVLGQPRLTPYGEDTYSLEMAEKNFKPVTHGQAWLTKFNIVDNFGQVVSPIHLPNKSQSFYSCVGRSISCHTNGADGGKFANGVELDDEKLKLLAGLPAGPPHQPGRTSQHLQQLIRRMFDTKFLVGLWAMLSEACQNIYHDPLSGDTQMLNMSYQDLFKPNEITLDDYKFEVMLGDKSNLRDGFIGYFLPAAGSVIKDPVAIRTDTQSLSLAIARGPDCAFSNDPAAHQRATCNHPSTIILGAAIDPYMPIHIATGILPSKTLKLPQ